MKKDTTQWEHANFTHNKCDKCERPATHCQFYYPTEMNGDAELEKSFCDEHYIEYINTL